MDSNVEIDMKKLLASGAVNRATRAYFEARLADVKQQLVIAGDNNFKQLQGRALELQGIIKLIELARE